MDKVTFSLDLRGKSISVVNNATRLTSLNNLSIDTTNQKKIVANQIQKQFSESDSEDEKRDTVELIDLDDYLLNNLSHKEYSNDYEISSESSDGIGNEDIFQPESH